MSATVEERTTEETQAAETQETQTQETETQTTETQEADAAKTTEPEKVEIGAEELRKMQQAQADYKGLEEKFTRLKGVAGRQSKEIAAGKAAQPEEGEEKPEPRKTRRRPAEFKPDEEGRVTYRGVEMELAEAEMRRDDDEERRNITARLDADDKRRKDDESAQLAQDEENATLKVRKQVVDVGVQSAMATLKIEDEETAAVAEFMVDSMLRATAAERKTPFETMDADGLTAMLTEEVVPAMERILSFRHREQTKENEDYRTSHPGKTGGAPGVPVDKLPSQMTEEERLKFYEAKSAEHAGGAT